MTRATFSELCEYARTVCIFVLSHICKLRKKWENWIGIVKALPNARCCRNKRAPFCQWITNTYSWDSSVPEKPRMRAGLLHCTACGRLNLYCCLCVSKIKKGTCFGCVKNKNLSATPAVVEGQSLHFSMEPELFAQMHLSEKPDKGFEPFAMRHPCLQPLLHTMVAHFPQPTLQLQGGQGPPPYTSTWAWQTIGRAGGPNQLAATSPNSNPSSQAANWTWACNKQG